MGVVEIVRPKYCYLRIIPDKSINTYNSSVIAKMVAGFERGLGERVDIGKKHCVIEEKMKCAYFIDISKKDVKFTLIVPDIYKNIAKEKIRSVWNKVTIEEIEGIEEFGCNSVEYELGYKNEDALSLEVDKRSNTLINSILNVIDVLEDGDRIGVYCNMMPYNNRAWASEHIRTISKWKEGMPVTKNVKDIKYLAKVGGKGLIDLYGSVLEGCLSVVGDDVAKKGRLAVEDLRDTITKENIKLSNATTKKKENIILQTQIGVISESAKGGLTSANLNAITVCQSFNAISEDNELEYKRVKGKGLVTDLTASKNKGMRVNKMSVEECYNFIELPKADILDAHKIKCINVLETSVYEELRQGYINLGDCIYRGMVQKAYMSTDDNLANLGLVVLGPQGSGKSVFFSNYGSNVVNYGEGLILIDFIGNCQLSDDIIKTLDPKKVVVINLAKRKDMQSIAFNEVVNAPDNYGSDDEDDDCDDKVLKVANDQAQLLISFIDSINRESKLTPRMRRAISAVCNVVFIQPNMSLRDVVRCLSDVEVRHDFIDRVPEEYRGELEEEIAALEEMDEYDKDGEIVGTKSSKVDFVIDRVSLLIEDRKMKYMYKKSMSENLDFVKLMEEGKSIFIKIPETEYPTEAQKNILVTFFICKLWMAAKIRYAMHSGKQLRYHIILDEIFQAPNCYGELQDILLQARKFRCKFVFSAHFLNKLEKLKECIKASGSSYMFLQGTDKKNFEEMEEDLAPFTVEDLLSLKRYHSINMIKCNKGFNKFITKLPPPLDETKAYKKTM